ncbi:MAG: hypothetical protein QOK03_621, partial [Candidatus Binataceae bacterium]|nr:hypothetical protein [Candidatus Binataceae bacterium]
MHIRAEVGFSSLAHQRAFTLSGF